VLHLFKHRNGPCYICFYHIGQNLVTLSPGPFGWLEIQPLLLLWKMLREDPTDCPQHDCDFKCQKLNVIYNRHIFRCFILTIICIVLILHIIKGNTWGWFGVY
jgi:hypothetical protein